jgi:hypothetical protein
MRLPLIFLLLLPTSLFALPFTDSRNLALGGMAIASVPVESAMFLNPALLGDSEGLRTTFTQVRFSANNFDFELSGAFPLVKDVVGLGFGWDADVSLNQLQTGIVRDSNGQVEVDPNTGLPLTQILGFFTQSNNAFYLSAGARFGFYSLGASLKYYLQDFGSLEGKGWGLDASAEYRLSGRLRLGLALLDLNSTTLRFNQGQADLVYPNLLMGSLAWDLLRLGYFTVQLDPGYSVGVWNRAGTQWSAGLEASWHEDIYVRAGANGENESFGIGLVTHPTKVFSEVKVDYTYLTRTPDGYPSRLTLTVGW